MDIHFDKYLRQAYHNRYKQGQIPQYILNQILRK